MTDRHAEQPRDSVDSPDGLLRALAHADRRTLLAELAACDGDSIDAAELATRAETVSRVELYHCHLPKLADAGLVAFDRKSGRVEYTPTDAAEAVLAVVGSHFE